MNWRQERERMEKLATQIPDLESESMSKKAQAPWRTAIDAVTTPEELSNVFAHFNRNRWVSGWAHPYGKSGLKTGIEKGHDLGDMKTQVKQFLSGYTNPPEHAEYATPITQLTPEQLSMRQKMSAERHEKFKVRKGSEAMNIDTGHDPEEWLPVIHGTNRAKAEAFVQTGNGPTRTESSMRLPDGTVTNMGINVHSKFGERADHYAASQAARRGGDPVVMTGEIQRKYLFPNPARGAGYGDEFAIPSQYHDKIRNTALRLGTISPSEFM